jgi:hypothetical protein
LDSGDVMIRASVKYNKNMVTLLEIPDAKTVSSPSLKEDRPDDDEELTAEAARIFRSCVGIALDVMPDRPDMQRDAQILTRNLREPKAFDKRLVRLARYMKGTSRAASRARCSWNSSATQTSPVARRRGER